VTELETREKRYTVAVDGERVSASDRSREQ